MQQKTDLMNDQRYLAAVSDMASRIDRILSGQETVNVQCVPVPPRPGVPAYQMGADIRLVPSEIRDMLQDPTDEREVLPLLLALNMHEFGHFEYTPNPNNPTWRTLKYTDPTWPQVFRMLNMLEDQRQELLVSVRFPRARHYFRLVNLRAMLKVTRSRGGIPPENFVLYYGRRHILPRPLLARLESQMVKKYTLQTVATIKDLIDEFLRLASTTKYALKRQWEIAKQMLSLLGVPPQEDREPCLMQGSIGSRTNKREQEKRTQQASQTLDKIDAKQKELAEQDVEPEDEPEQGEDAKSDKGSPNEPKQDEASDSDKAQESDSGDPGEQGEPSSEESGEDKPETGKGSESADEEDEELDDEESEDDAGDQPEDSADSADESDSEDTEDTEDDSEDGADGGAGNSEQSDASDELADALADYLQRAESLASGELGERSEQVRSAIVGVAARRLSNVFKQVSTDLGLVDRNRLRVGKLDVRRVPAAVAQADARIFRERRPNLKREAGMLVHVMLDSSGSMNTKKQTALDATGTIGRACDLAGHRAKITTFSSQHQTATLKEWADADIEQNKLQWFGGGTDPTALLADVEKDFRRASIAYKLANRVLLIVTDGGFDYNAQDIAAEQFVKLKRAGVHTFFVAISVPGKDDASDDASMFGKQYFGPVDAHGYCAPLQSPKPYAIDDLLSIANVTELEAAMRGMLSVLAVKLAHEASARYS